MRMMQWALINCLALASLCGCSGKTDVRSSSTTPSTARPTTQFSTPAPTLAPAALNRDHVVIEVALADLLALPESPLASRKVPPAEIKFAPRATTYPVKATRILMRRDKEKWAALSKEQLDGASEAAEEIVRRNYAADGFKPFEPRDPRVRLDDGAPTPGRNLRFDRPVSAWPPGYSADGNHAIVFLSIPWSMHHADATYLLARDGDGWRIVLRQFVYYV